MATPSIATPSSDERVVQVSFVRRIFRLPEVGSIVGAIVIASYFAYNNEVFRSVRGLGRILDTATPLGIMAVAVALLMIGGEFDLSAGAMIGSVGLIIGILTVEEGWNLWGAILAALVFALTVGFINGVLVLKTGLPSFIVTLGTFFIIRGGNVGVTIKITEQVRVTGLDKINHYRKALGYFNSEFTLPFALEKYLGKDIAKGVLDGFQFIIGKEQTEQFYVTTFRVSTVWWIFFTVLATWLLLRTSFGSWVFAVGGDVRAARAIGVPVQRVKISLFMLTSGAAWFVGTMNALRLKGTVASAGVGDEFEFVIAAVIGGCLLTGGYGSAIGASIGALIFGMARVGINFSGWNTDWFYSFLGAMLLLSVLLNNFTRKQAERVSVAKPKSKSAGVTPHV